MSRIRASITRRIRSNASLRLWQAVAAALIAATLFLSSPALAAAADQIVEADLSYSRVDASGLVTARPEGLVGLVLKPGVRGLDFDLYGDQVRVNTTRTICNEFGDARKPSQSCSTPTPTSERQRPYHEETFEWARGRPNASSNASHIMIVARTPQVTTGIETSAMSLGAPTRAVMLGGQNHNMTKVGGSSNPASAEVQVPVDSVESSLSHGTLTLRGNVSIYLWNANLELLHRDGRSEFRSGEWTRPKCIGGVCLPMAGAWERETQLLRLDVPNATLRLNITGDALWAAHRADVGASKTIFHQARGVALTPTDTIDLKGKTLVLEGDIHFSTSNPQGEGPKASLRVERHEAPTALVGAAGRSRAALLIGGAVAAAAAGGGYVRHRRTHVPPLGAVEWAILKGHPGRASRLAARVLRSQPNDADVLFLYGSALWMQGKHRTMLRRMEPLIDKVPPAGRPPVAFLLALAARAAAKPASERRWVREAAVQEHLRRQLAQSGLHGPDTGYA